jgi:carbonic anhydrase/acetyltransferase-like protein (isoleucine patch superfamily)
MGAILLPNTYCEAGVIVAAGSVVLQGTRILTRKLVAGNPARVIKDVTPEQDEYAEAGIKEYKNLLILYKRTMKQISV